MTMRYKLTVALKGLFLWHCGREVMERSVIVAHVIVAQPGTHTIGLEGIMTVQSVC